MGDKLKMVEKNGQQVPFYAADGKGKMKSGGQAKMGYKGGGQAKSKKRYMDGGCAIRGTRDTKMA